MNSLRKYYFLFSFFHWGTPSIGYSQVTPVDPTTGVSEGAPVVPSTDAVAAWTANATFKYGLLDALSGIVCYIQTDLATMASLELGLGLTRKNILFEAATGSGDNNGYFLSDFNSPYWQVLIERI